ncbi:ADP-ribosylhydrolase ARH3-like [Euwallacea similis]|uniref:ADP-ribosylhydrolase ARH3-like n=1 Tax=Euwallacea similis TaxID=1736056 RepID=UPI00344D6C37
MYFANTKELNKADPSAELEKIPPPEVHRMHYRGCLLGILMGDCMGSAFKGQKGIDCKFKTTIQQYFDSMEVPNSANVCPLKIYSDKTATTLVVLKYLLDRPDPPTTESMRYFAILLVDEYFKGYHRGYGQNAASIFQTLRNIKFSNILLPARVQPQNRESAGYGSAVRVAPIALFKYFDSDTMLDFVSNTSKVTHHNRVAVHAAMLQCLAIRRAVMYPEPLDVTAFCKYLQNEIKTIESNKLYPSEFEAPLFSKLIKMECLLRRDHMDVPDHEVIEILGNGIEAHESVITAIYCFLRTLDPVYGINTYYPVRRAIQYAVSLGGESDAIASMAGALSGAHFGESHINMCSVQHCEAYQDIQHWADKLVQHRFLYRDIL